MTVPQITVTFDPPTPADNQEVFNFKAFDTVAKWQQWGGEANAMAVSMNAALDTVDPVVSNLPAIIAAPGAATSAANSAAAATAAASTATARATAANNSAVAAAASATSAQGNATSASNSAGTATAAAATATTAATTATNAATAASNSATSAAESAASALATAAIFDSVALGLAGTTNGKYFSVPVPGSNDFLILYKNQAGVAVEKGRYPSAQAVQSVRDDLASTEPGKGAALVGFKQIGSLSASRDASDKMREFFTVKDFGAIGDGSDATSAFQKAAESAIGYNSNPDVYSPIPASTFAFVRVPVGTYLLTSNIDPKGKDLIWILDPGTKINGIDYLGGRVFIDGLRINAKHHGILDHSVSFSVNANRGSLGKPAAIMGITNPNQLSAYRDRDSVAVYVENGGLPPAFVCSLANFTSLSLVPQLPVDVSLLRVGMIIDTDHSPNIYSGMITSWEPDGSKIYVSGWYEVSGSIGPAVTPPNGANAYINAYTKVWAHNANVTLSSDSHATRAAGFELGLSNGKYSTTDPSDPKNYMWGYDTVCFGPNAASVGYIARTGFLRGFESSGAIQEGFTVTDRNGIIPTTAFRSKSQAFNQIWLTDKDGNNIFKVTNGANLEIGSMATGASERSIRFRSSGLNADFDTRTQSIGGESASGQGTYRITAKFVESNGRLQPNIDNAHQLGGGSNRWTQVFAATGAINTSDEREKQDIKDLNDAEIRAATRLKSLIKKFRFRDAVDKKGDGARIHFGVIAQEVINAFAAEGLDATRYGIICYDEWEEMPEIKDEEGNVTQEYRPAGNRYGVRYEELLAFIIAAI